MGLLGCTYVRVGECVSDRVGEKESLARDGEALRKRRECRYVCVSVNATKK